MNRPSIAVLAGPTATGKTGLAIEIARAVGAEIVSADSMQVYRRLDIGTAKPTREQRSAVRHHLIDVAEPDEPFDAVRFRDAADAAIAEIAARGKRVIVAGGTGLYLRVLLFGLADLPPPQPGLRAKLEREAATIGAAELHRRLGALDPAAAARIHPADKFRIVRALEVHAVAGRPISELQAEHRFSEPRYPHAWVALDVPRDELRARILGRARGMLAAGLLGEVRGILSSGYAPEMRPLRAFGYREPVRCVLGMRTEDGLDEAIATDTWRYAKRQVTWLRSESTVEWHRPSSDDISRRFRRLWEE